MQSVGNRPPSWHPNSYTDNLPVSRESFVHHQAISRRLLQATMLPAYYSWKSDRDQFPPHSPVICFLRDVGSSSHMGLNDVVRVCVGGWVLRERDLSLRKIDCHHLKGLLS